MTQIVILAAAALATAQIAHEVNRAHCIAIGDDSQLPWDAAPDWQRDTVLMGVEFHVLNPDADASASHESWMAQKVSEGWIYGEVKDPEKKTHPCMVPFADLPLPQQEKDILFKAVVAVAYPILVGVEEDAGADLRSEVDSLTAKLAAAEARAKAAKLSAGEKTAKPRKIGSLEKRLTADELKAAIAKADKVEILFGDGTKESGPAPVLVEGDAWADHALGLMLKEPVALHGPAHGGAPYHVKGYALLLDGKQVAWTDRPDPLQVGAGQKYQLSNDIFF